MRSMNVFEELQYEEKNAVALPLWVDAHSRIVRFSLLPGQEIKEHTAPSSPLYIFVISGNAEFTGGQSNDRHVFGPDSLIVFDVGEPHSVKALEEKVVFIAYLAGVSDQIPPEKAGGILGRKDPI